MNRDIIINIFKEHATKHPRFTNLPRTVISNKTLKTLDEKQELVLEIPEHEFGYLANEIMTMVDEFQTMSCAHCPVNHED